MSKPAKNLPPEPAPSTELAPVPAQSLTLQKRALAALGEHDEAELKKLADGTKDITIITNAAGHQQVHAARMVLKNTRIAIEKDGKKAREEAVAFGKAVIVETDRLIAITMPEEQRLEGIQTEWESARRREKEAKEAAERQRVAALQARVDELRHLPLEATDLDSQGIESLIKKVVDFPIDSTFAELQQQAEGAKATTLIRLRAAHTKALAFEAEQKRVAEERAALERQRAEEEARQAEERKRIAAEERLAREAREEEFRRQAEEAQRRQAEIDAENARIRRQNEVAAEVERQRMATAEAVLQGRIEAQRAESARLEAEREEQSRQQAQADAARQAEAQRLAAERAQLERDQETLRLAQEKAAAPVETSVALPESTELPDVTVTVGGEPMPTVRVETTPEPLLASIDFKELLAMQTVCQFAKEWAVFQDRDSKLDQKTDRKLAARAKEAEANLLAVVEQLP